MFGFLPIGIGGRNRRQVICRHGSIPMGGVIIHAFAYKNPIGFLWNQSRKFTNITAR